MGEDGDSRDDEYRSRIYDNYRSALELGSDWQRSDPSLLRDVVSRLPADRGVRILDAGCGPGGLMRLLRANGYTRVEGVDVSPDQIHLAQQDGLTAIEADLFDYLEGRDDRFDVILAIDLLEHFDVANVLRLLALFRNSLAPNGQLVLRTPNASGPFGARLRYGDLTHGLAFTPSSIRQALLTTGYTKASVRPQEPAPHGLFSMVRLVLWRLLALGAKAYLAVETGVLRGHIVSQNLIAVARVPRD